MPGPDVEPHREALLAEARRRFGPERTQILAPDLEQTAADLARVAEAPLPPEGEPGFFLLEEPPP